MAGPDNVEIYDPNDYDEEAHQEEITFK